MSLYKLFETDPQAEEQGVILNYGTSRVTVARAGGANKAYRKMLEAEMKPYQKLLSAGVFTNDQAEEVLKLVAAKTLVKNWEVLRDGQWVKGIDNPEEGEPPLPFTVDNVLLTFNNLDDVYRDIRDNAQSSTLYRLSLREAAAGN